MVAEVISIKRGRPSLRAEQDLDHAFHASEELEQARSIEPLLMRLAYFAQDYGPAAMQAVAVLDNWHRRHARRWADERDVEAAA